MNYCDETEGGIFFIPLTLPNNIKNNRKNYYMHKFIEEDKYAFGRLIESDKTNGDLIEVFKYVGNIPSKKEEILKTGRLFDPLHVSMGFEKQRWRFIFSDKNYNKINDSQYDKISFLIGDYDTPILWMGGKKLGSINTKEMNKYNHWVIYAPTQLENKIRDSLE